MSVFDQTCQTNDSHILDIQEENFPEKYREIIRRLQRAIAEPKIRKVMDVEDEILESMQSYERAIAIKDKKIEDNLKALEQKDKTIEEKDRLIQELQDKLNRKKS